MNEPDEYRLRWRGRESGPFSLEEINRQLDDHEIGTSHEIFHRDDWISLEAFFEAQKPVAAPPVEPVETPAPIRVSTPVPGGAPVPRNWAKANAALDKPPRRRLLYAFLAIIGGFVGLHNFYARQWLTGLLQLLLSIATYLMGFGIIAAWLWAVAEAVFIRKDGEGIEMI